MLAGEGGDDVGLRGGLGGVRGGHQVAVGDDGGEQGLGDDVGAAGAVAMATYSISGWKAMARDAGRVQGVVVQMMA